MKTTRPSLTSLPLSPDEERRRRVVKYSVAMGIRVVCLIVAVIVPGWWAAVPLVGAIFLPYFAVVIANVGADPRRDDVQRPGNILPMGPQSTPTPPPAGEARDGQEEQ